MSGRRREREMDLSAVARQKARGGRAEPASPSATASMEADDHDSEGSDDDQPDPESAKQYVKQFVKNSLDGVRGGRRAQYYEVLEALDGLASATPSGDPDKLLMLEVLGENVSSLDERLHEELLRRVMGTSLWLCHEDIARLVVQFCVNLMSTHTGSMLATCLDMLVEAFLPPRGYPEGRLEDELDAYMRTGQSPSLGADAIREDMDDDESDPKGPPPRSAAETTAMIVGAITQILTLVPLSATVLGGILLRRIPHKTAVKARQCQYLRAAFALVETPAGRPLRDGLLRGVVRHLLDVDVEIKWQDIAPDGDLSEDDETEVEDEEDDGKENGAGGIFELEDIEKTIEQELVRQAAAWERGESGASGARQGSIRSPMHHGGRDEIEEQIDMIDSMMTLVLAHIDRRIDSGDGVALNECLLKVFVSTLLPAHESKFTQFLVFHACAREAAAKATSPALGANGPRVANAVGEFDGTGALSARIVDQLIGRVTDPIARPAPRLASAAYLASFLARAAWLRPPFLAATLRRLASWCWATVESATSGAGVTSVARVKSEGLSRGFGSSFQINVGDENGENGEGGGGDDNTNAKNNNNNNNNNNNEATDTEQLEFANASAATLAVFDSACQTLMYVLCYRMDDITRHGGEPAETLRSMPLRQILYSRLQPLHTCVSEVVVEFLVRAAAAGMEGFDQALVARHKREDKERKDRAEGGGGAGGGFTVEDVAAQAVGEGSRAGSHNGAAGMRRTQSVATLGREVAEAVRHRRPLRMFFPFDPYLLRRSSALLRLPQSYVTWRGNARDDDEDADGFSDDDDDDDDDLATVDSELGSEDVGESSSDDDTDPGGGAGRRDDSLSSRGAKPGSGGSLPNSLGYPNSLNPRPRKLTRGLRGPQPLFGGVGGGNSPSPTGGKGLGSELNPTPPGANPFARASVGAGTSPDAVVTGFGVPVGAETTHARAWAAAAGTGVPTGVGFGRGGSVSPTRKSPSPLGTSPLPPRPPRPS